MNKDNQPTSEFYQKMFYVLSLTCFVSNVFGCISNAALYGVSFATYVYGASAVIVGLCGIYGYVTKRIRIANAIILLLISWLEFPYIFLTYGTSTLLYFIVAIVAIAVFLPAKVRTIYFLISMAVDLGALFYQKMYATEIIDRYDEDSVFIAIIFTFVIIAVAVYVMLVQFVVQYDKQRQKIIEMSRRLEQAANMDALTQIYNRRYLTEILEQYQREDKRDFVVALLDIDDFKKINDTYGHVYGDEVLVEFGRLMRTEIAGFGFAARFGGEEFMLVFDNTDKSNALTVLNRIGAKLKDFSLRTKDIAITFSGGLEEYDNEVSINELFNRVDEKLYRSKTNGKSQITV